MNLKTTLMAALLATGLLLPAGRVPAHNPSQASPAADRDRLGPALGAVLQADGPTARARLEALTDLSAPVERTRQCILQRLDPDGPLPAPEADASFTDKALHAYRLYWREAANAPETRDEALTRLTTRLAGLLGQPDTDQSAAERMVLERIRSEGRHALAGRTGLLLELMVWSGQEERNFDVELPEGRHVTRVFLLSDFQNRGWSNWLACGATGTGGWANSEGLYVVEANVGDLTDENFRVSLLGHETQHFSDYTSWPGLPGRELEFRAKLTELSMAEATLSAVLRAFERNQSDNEADAHSHANKRVLAALRVRLGLPADGDLTAVPGAALREAARQELFADSARRRSAAGGPASN